MPIRNKKMSWHNGRKEYRVALADRILQMLKGGNIIFIDCVNCIDQYMFDMTLPDLEKLYVVRIEVIYDLVDLIERISSTRLLLSPYRHLLSCVCENERRKLEGRLDAGLINIGRTHDVEVIEWDIPYLQNEK